MAFVVIGLALFFEHFIRQDKDMGSLVFFILLSGFFTQIRMERVDEVLVDAEAGRVTLKYSRPISGKDKVVFYLEDLELKRKKRPFFTFSEHKETLVFKKPFGPRYELGEKKDHFPAETLLEIEQHIKAAQDIQNRQKQD